MIRTIHRAKFVLAESDLLLQNAAIHVSDPGRISRLEPWHGPPADREVEVIDWGCAAILPGFVNAHAHLDLTDFHNQIGDFTSFTDWLMQLVRKRRQWTVEDYRRSVHRGAVLALSCGTTLVGDISSGGVTSQALQSEKLRKVVFEESLGLRPEDATAEAVSLEKRLACIALDPLLALGVSPHATYSVSPRLFAEVAELARQKGILIATHVAETSAELQFLQTGRGEFRDFLTQLGVLPPDWMPPRVTPITYLDQMGILEQSPLLIHGNYLDAESMSQIHSSQCSVVYCPRSHAYFGFDRHPVRELLDLGVNVALGTDSLASNDSLSVLDEMRFLFDRRKDLNCGEIWRMATLNGASALRYGGLLGRLRRGYWADMAILQLPEQVIPRNLTAQILEGAGECVATIVAGKLVWQKDEIRPCRQPGNWEQRSGISP